MKITTELYRATPAIKQSEAGTSSSLYDGLWQQNCLYSLDWLGCLPIGCYPSH